MYLKTIRESVIQRVQTSEVNRDVRTDPEKPGKVLNLSCGIFQGCKVLEKANGPEKCWKESSSN